MISTYVIKQVTRNNLHVGLYLNKERNRWQTALVSALGSQNQGVYIQTTNSVFVAGGFKESHV